MKTTVIICLSLLGAALVTALCLCACGGGEGRPGKEAMIVELDTTGRIYCRWEPSASADKNTVYRVALILEDGTPAAEFETRESGAWLFDRIAYYLQNNGGTDITFYVSVRAYNGGAFFAAGSSETVTLTGVIPSSSERTVGRDVALDDVLSFAYHGTADYKEGNFGYYVYKAAYGADYEYRFFTEKGSFDDEKILSPEDWDELVSMLEGVKLVNRSFDDPELEMLDGSSETMSIRWGAMRDSDVYTELVPDAELKQRIVSWLVEKAAGGE